MGMFLSIQNFGKEIYRTYVTDQPNHFAAAISYYSLFSLIPNIYIAFEFSGLFIDNAVVTQHMFAEIENLLGGDVVELLLVLLEAISKSPSSGTMFERLFSSSAMLFGASLLFFKLQFALNSIWKIPHSTEGQTKTLLLNRLFSFMTVLCVGIFVMFTSLAFILVSFLESILQIHLNSPFLNFGANLTIIIVGIAILFKLLPNARVGWFDAFIGGAVTASLLTAGTKGLGWYLANSKFGSFIDALGAVALLLIAIYFLSQIFIFGAVFTRVFAEIYGGGITPLKPVESKHRRS
jgi:membrane protein